jgi:transcriptional regulator GlxA family with amidase domain
MLRHDPRSIEQIADACGFSSPVYLNQFFQREAGMAPGAYRKAFGEFFGGR